MKRLIAIATLSIFVLAACSDTSHTRAELKDEMHEVCAYEMENTHGLYNHISLCTCIVNDTINGSGKTIEELWDWSFEDRVDYALDRHVDRVLSNCVDNTFWA